jgi:hypothetical protein
MAPTEGMTPGAATEPAGGAIDLVTRAARDGAASAREAANRTWSASSLFVSRFVYTTCYTISYGVVFPTTLLALSIPRNNAVVRGLVEGAQAASRQVDRIRGAALESSHSDSAKSLAHA